jgi:hypothetical protein
MLRSLLQVGEGFSLLSVVQLYYLNCKGDRGWFTLLSQSPFWGLAPSPSLGSDRRSPNPFRKVFMVDDKKRFALPPQRGFTVEFTLVYRMI